MYSIGFFSDERVCPGSTAQNPRREWPREGSPDPAKKKNSELKPGLAIELDFSMDVYEASNDMPCNMDILLSSPFACFAQLRTDEDTDPAQSGSEGAKSSKVLVIKLILYRKDSFSGLLRYTFMNKFK